MSKVRQEVELAVRVKPHQAGLKDVFQIIASRNINILAYCSYFGQHEAVVLLITNNSPAAKAALQSAGYVCDVNHVVVVSDCDRVGAAAQLGTQLDGAGVRILYSYASSLPGNQYFAVFKTSDDEQALRVLQVTHHAHAA